VPPARALHHLGRVVLAAVFLALSSVSTSLGEQPRATDEVFERYRAGVFQIVTIERASGARASLGSGFFVDAEGRAVTNFHVVSQVVHGPDAYHLELHQQGEAPRPLELLAVDVVHDLAVVRDARQPALHLELAEDEPLQGTRLYSFGNPHDLGAAVVEGTFNGMIETSFYENYHFTGAINSGMSGGPTVDGEGRVIGVNVATLRRGNLVGFLVPVKHVRVLLQAAQDEDAPPLLEQVRDQLLANQEALADWMLAHLTTTRLGSYRLPRIDSESMHCWGDRRARSFETYTKTRHGCSLAPWVFISSEHDTGGVGFDHTLLSSSELNRFQFYALLEQEFGRGLKANRAAREDVGRYACHTDFVDRDGLRLKAVLCLRAYRKLPGLYEGVFKAVTLAENDVGLTTELRLSGFAPETVERLPRRFLKVITWAPE
jgi:serine protease Do